MSTIEQKKAEQRERGIQRNMQSCRYFNGVQNVTCLAGLVYEDAHPSGTLLPCIPIGSDPSRAGTCEKKSCWTREESEANQDDIERRSKKGLTAVLAAHADAKAKGYGKKAGGQDSLKCPICPDGTLRYSVSSYNGHMSASCTTANCISWME